MHSVCIWSVYSVKTTQWQFCILGHNVSLGNGRRCVTLKVPTKSALCVMTPCLGNAFHNIGFCERWFPWLRPSNVELRGFNCCRTSCWTNSRYVVDERRHYIHVISLLWLKNIPIKLPYHGDLFHNPGLCEWNPSGFRLVFPYKIQVMRSFEIFIAAEQAVEQTVNTSVIRDAMTPICHCNVGSRNLSHCEV